MVAGGCWDGKCGFVNPSGSLRLKETEWARYSRSSDHGACWDDDGLPRTFGVPHQTKFTPACQGKPTAQTAAVIGPHGNQGGLSERITVDLWLGVKSTVGCCLEIYIVT